MIIQKSSTIVGKTDEEKLRDADLFLTKIGIDDYNFDEEPLDDGPLTDSDGESEDLEAIEKQKKISELNKKMHNGIQKASDELADQLNDIRALK